jgi:membrane-bound inhibitor of C-type lysozyme
MHLRNPSPNVVMRNLTLVLTIVFLSLTLVLACGQKEEPAKTKKPIITTGMLVFHCENDKSFTVKFDAKGESVLLQMDDKSIRLPHVPSGSGAKYSDGRTIVWMKGDEAFVEVNGKIILKDCKIRR